MGEGPPSRAAWHQHQPPSMFAVCGFSPQMSQLATIWLPAPPARSTIAQHLRQPTLKRPSSALTSAALEPRRYSREHSPRSTLSVPKMCWMRPALISARPPTCRAAGGQAGRGQNCKAQGAGAEVVWGGGACRCEHCAHEKPPPARLQLKGLCHAAQHMRASQVGKQLEAGSILAPHPNGVCHILQGRLPHRLPAGEALLQGGKRAAARLVGGVLAEKCAHLGKGGRWRMCCTCMWHH